MCNRREYLEDILKVRKENEKEYLDTMDKYSFDWWLSQNPEEIVRYQLKEPLLLVLFSKLQNALEAVLQRPVQADEIRYINIPLKLDAFRVIGN